MHMAFVFGRAARELPIRHDFGGRFWLAEAGGGGPLLDIVSPDQPFLQWREAFARGLLEDRGVDAGCSRRISESK